MKHAYFCDVCGSGFSADPDPRIPNSPIHCQGRTTGRPHPPHRYRDLGRGGPGVLSAARAEWAALDVARAILRDVLDLPTPETGSALTFRAAVVAGILRRYPDLRRVAVERTADRVLATVAKNPDLR